MVHYQVRSITVRTADRAKALRSRRHPELDAYAEVALTLGADCDSKDVLFGSSAVPGFCLDSNVAGAFGVSEAIHAGVALQRPLSESCQKMWRGCRYRRWYLWIKRQFVLRRAGNGVSGSMPSRRSTIVLSLKAPLRKCL
eukprot:3355341-Amphidinium_carterae.1